jgi:hypothetical protein
MPFRLTLAASAAALTLASAALAQQQTAITTIPLDQIRIRPAPAEPAPPTAAAPQDRPAQPQAATPRQAPRAVPREWRRDVVGLSREMGRGVCAERGIPGLAEKAAAEHRGERITSIIRWEQARECRVVIVRDALATKVVVNLPAPWTISIDTRQTAGAPPAMAGTAPPPPSVLAPAPAPAWTPPPTLPPAWSPTPPPGWQPLPSGAFAPPQGAFYTPPPQPQAQSLSTGLYDIIGLINAGQALRYSLR